MIEYHRYQKINYTVMTNNPHSGTGQIQSFVMQNGKEVYFWKYIDDFKWLTIKIKDDKTKREISLLYGIDKIERIET